MSATPGHEHSLNCTVASPESSVVSLATMTSSSLLVALPVELKEMIASCVHTGSWDLPSFRLACKDLEASCFRLFVKATFAHVTILLLSSDSIARLSNVAHSPRIGLHVKTLTVQIAQFTTKGLGSSLSDNDKQMYAGLLAEQEMNANSGVLLGSLTEALQPLANLQSIYFSDCFVDLRSYNFRGLFSSDVLSRNHEWESAWYESSSTLDVKLRFHTIVATAVARSGVKLERWDWSTSYYEEDSSHDMSLPYSVLRLDGFQKVLENLMNLSLVLPSSPRPLSTDKYLEVKEMLDIAPQLEELSLTFQNFRQREYSSYDLEPRLSGALRTVKLVNLKSLQLSFVALEPRILNGFLLRHQNTLSTLKLCHANFGNSEAFLSVLRLLKEKLTLRYLSLENLKQLEAVDLPDVIIEPVDHGHAIRSFGDSDPTAWKVVKNMGETLTWLIDIIESEGSQ